jgi:hypothetical protein
MKRIVLSLFLLALFYFETHAQEKLVPLNVNPALNSRPKNPLKSGSPTYFSNPYSYYSKTDQMQDDFSAPGPYPDSAKWIDNTVFVNTDYPVAPINIGVATFDGINKYGYPYDFTAAPTLSVPCDTLTSKRIRMTGAANDSSYFLSFYYQAQGRGNAPEPEDSLFLEFRSSRDSITWREMWAHPGYSLFTPDTSFHRAMIPLYKHGDTAQYVAVNWFQFRFRNYATPCGNLDHWNLDCVDLRPGRTAHDTIIAQVSFVYQPLSFLANYQSMPWKQYKGGADIAANAHIYVRNNDVGNRNVTYEYQGSHYGVPFSTPWNGATDPGLPPFLTNGYSSYAPTAFPPVASNGFSFGNSLSDTTAFQINHILYENIANKDTIKTIQRFYNYYAYDDGTAELGYGLEGTGTAAGAQLAVGFTTNIADTLRGVQYFWNPILKNVSLDGFRLCVWAAGANNQPGALIYKSDSLFTPQYLSGYDHYRTYKIDGILKISGRFFVGWEQYTEDNLSIGFDQNTDASANNFFKIDSLGIWNSSVFPGSLMIRPLFGDTIKMTGIHEAIAPLDFVKLYPNPAQDRLYISIPETEGSAQYRIELIDRLGKLLSEKELSRTEPLDVSSLPNGFYFVRITGRNKMSCTKKLLIAR